MEPANMGRRNFPQTMDPARDASAEDKYVERLLRAVSEQLTAHLQREGASAYRLGDKKGKLTDQSIRNMQLGRQQNGPLLGSLARVCHRVRRKLWEFIRDAEDG